MEFNYDKVFQGSKEVNQGLENILVHNSTLNMSAIMSRIGSGVYTPLEKMPRVFKPAIVCGSGPSLDDLPKYAGLNPTVFASASHLSTVVHHLGRDPEFAVAVDCRDALARKVSSHMAEPLIMPNTTLCVHPGVSPFLLGIWDGPVCVYRPLNPSSYFKSKVLPVMYSIRERGEKGETEDLFVPVLNIGVFDSGCVASTALSLAAFMGYSPIFLLGVDFSFDGEKGSCGEWGYSEGPDGIGGWNFLGRRSPSCFGEIQYFRGKPTSKEMLIYQFNLIVLWRLLGCELYNLSDVSMLTEIPKWKGDIKKLFTKGRKRTYPIKNIIQYVDGCLKNEYGVQLSRVGNGVMQLQKIE